MTTDPSTDKISAVNCPNCAANVRWESASAFRPFCSARCQQLDFGEWARESYSIPTSAGPDMLDIDAEADF